MEINVARVHGIATRKGSDPCDPSDPASSAFASLLFAGES
jgi:hypothetical protein